MKVAGHYFQRWQKIRQWLLVVFFIAALPVAALAAKPFTLESARVAANRGNAKALYFLAKYYSRGEEVPKDYPKAAEYMQKAADKGYAFAQNDLGSFYANGLGLKQDYGMAAKWYQKAAEKGDPLAQYSLGRAYWKGRGVETNMSLALKWLKKAARQDQAAAMEALGEIYVGGAPGLKADPRLAFHWFLQSADHGDEVSLYYLGSLLELGSGVPADMDLALDCYRRAAEAGIGIAQFRLGDIYLSGTGTVAADKIEAAKWLILASRQRIGNSEMLLDALRENGGLPPEQYQRADRYAHDIERAYTKSPQRPVK